MSANEISGSNLKMFQWRVCANSIPQCAIDEAFEGNSFKLEAGSLKKKTNLTDALLAQPGKPSLRTWHPKKFSAPSFP